MNLVSQVSGRAEAHRSGPVPELEDDCSAHRAYGNEQSHSESSILRLLEQCLPGKRQKETKGHALNVAM